MIKPINDAMGEHKQIAGAAILGSGKIGLILNHQQIAQQLLPHRIISTTEDLHAKQNWLSLLQTKRLRKSAALLIKPWVATTLPKKIFDRKPFKQTPSPTGN